MEKRVLLAIILSLAVLLLWQALSPPPKPRRVKSLPPQQLDQEAIRQEEVLPEKAMDKAVEVSSLPASKDMPEYASTPDKEIVVHTDLYTAVFSSRGARLKNFELLRYRDKITLPKICFIFPFSFLYGNKQLLPDDQPKELVNTGVFNDNPLQTRFDGMSLGHDGLAPFAASKELLELDNATPKGDITFSFVHKEGATITKTFTFFNDSYYMDYDFALKNNSSETLEGQPSVGWTTAIQSEGGKKNGGFFGGIGDDTQQFAYLISDEVNRIELKEVKENKTFSGDIKWAGFEDKYFVSSLIPQESQDSTLNLSRNENRAVDFQLISPMAKIPPNAKKSFPYALYLGPKDLNCLEKGRGELGRVVSFGFFDPVAKPMLFILNLFYKYIPNYGLAIIFLSVGIKIIFWPLTHKSQKSMKEMQKLQPKIAELKEKYKNNKEELNRRTMEFYRTHKVNPLGGCLPILIQIPVFFALYRVLLNSIELRHAPLVSYWINDLSSKDPTYISPLLMGASMFIQQKMTPTVGDPAQAKIMLMMPVIFTFMFLSFPSGLVLYWLVTNVLSIAQQYYINKHSS